MDSPKRPSVRRLFAAKLTFVQEQSSIPAGEPCPIITVEIAVLPVTSLDWIDTALAKLQAEGLRREWRVRLNE